jgi:quinol monooxygenase YgiN
MTTLRMACTMTLDRSDLDEVTDIFRTFIRDIHEKDYGVLTYHYYVDDEPTKIHVVEEYESPKAMVDHLANMDHAAVGRLLELVELSPLNYYGDPTPEAQAALAGFGQVLYHRPLVSIQDPAGQAV